MREIKFRGKLISGEWVYGNYSHIKKDFSTSRVKKGHYISNSVGSPFAFLVRPETVSQFIGLLDKNGKKVFEGDYLRTKFGVGQVCWDEQYLHYYILFDSENSDGSESLDIGWSKEVEVIGNIYE